MSLHIHGAKCRKCPSSIPSERIQEEMESLNHLVVIQDAAGSKRVPGSNQTSSLFQPGGPFSTQSPPQQHRQYEPPKGFPNSLSVTNAE